MITFNFQGCHGYGYGRGFGHVRVGVPCSCNNDGGFMFRKQQAALPGPHLRFQLEMPSPEAKREILYSVQLWNRIGPPADPSRAIGQHVINQFAIVSLFACRARLSCPLYPWENPQFLSALIHEPYQPVWRLWIS
jgi:hypothetical protein